MGVMVGVAVAFGSTGFGGNRFSGEFGKRKIITKYMPIQSVMSSIRQLSMSHVSRWGLVFGLDTSS